MGAWLRRNPLVALLGVAAVLLALVLALELGIGRRPPPASAPRKVALAEPRLFPPVAPAAPEQAYPETANRPLFTPTRRPAPVATAAPVVTMQRGQFVLLGVTMAGNTRIALLREKSTGRIHRVEPGREINGLRIAQIERESVTLAQGGEQEVLPLVVQRAAAAGAVPGTTPVAATGAVGQFGPFGPGQQPGTAAAGQPGAMPAGQPSASPFPQPTTAPTTATTAGAVPGALTPPQQAPQQAPQSANPMSPEELLARRRARRAQQNQ